MSRAFFSYAMNELIDNKCKIIIDPYSTISYSTDIAVGGYFLHKPKELAIATGMKFEKWFQIFIHEFSHFRQFMEQEPSFMLNVTEKAAEKFDKILSGSKKFSNKEVNHYCKILQDLEIDCERRTIELIKEYNLEIDVDLYTRKANAYIFLYTYIMKYRQWPDKKSPCGVKKIVDLMPSALLTDYSSIPEQYEELLTRYCYTK